MFGTIIIDAYKQKNKNMIVDALDELCNPNDRYGWSSAGIYSFWDYNTKEIYYIGLAIDLKERFKQHNKIIKVDKTSCKARQIDNYFENNNKLGYSIFVQSPLSQPITNKNKDQLLKHFLEKNYTGNIGKEHMKQVEGILIESYRKKHNEFPKWNKIGGLEYGQLSATKDNYEIIECLNTTNKLPPLVSKSTLREISKNPTYERFENFLHSIRINMLFFGLSYKTAFNMVIDLSKYNQMTYNDMIETNYFNKKLFV